MFVVIQSKNGYPDGDGMSVQVSGKCLSNYYYHYLFNFFCITVAECATTFNLSSNFLAQSVPSGVLSHPVSFWNMLNFGAGLRQNVVSLCLYKSPWHLHNIKKMLFVLRQPRESCMRFFFPFSSLQAYSHAMCAFDCLGVIIMWCMFVSDCYSFPVSSCCFFFFCSVCSLLSS